MAPGSEPETEPPFDRLRTPRFANPRVPSDRGRSAERIYMRWGGKPRGDRKRAVVLRLNQSRDRKRAALAQLNFSEFGICLASARPDTEAKGLEGRRC